ncbi:LIM and SH3 domain protein 1, partial [Blomia tropicalis]
MSKICARCDKTVYPIEELKCLDKLWHKSCFKCYECGMILNMKTYKGFNKLPYCNAHTPVARATTVVDTPETRRLAENTKIQSQAKYHADFEKQKGKLTQVADDPETLRIRNQSKIISNATYHGEYEKKKQMEERRGIFIDGDLVINCQPIDDGWMTGTVQRTGKTGMLPSNYVESTSQSENLSEKRVVNDKLKMYIINDCQLLGNKP